MRKGVQSAGQYFVLRGQLLGLLALAYCRRLRVIRSKYINLPTNVTRLHDERIHLFLVSPWQNRNIDINFVFLAFRGIVN